MRNRVLRSASVLAGYLAIVGLASAQAAAPVRPTAPRAPVPARPGALPLPPLPPPVAPAPVPDLPAEFADPWAAVEESAPPLSLADAVDTALRLHPSIQTARAELLGADANVTAQRGAFDTTLNGSLTYSHGESPLAPPLRSLPTQGPTVTDVTDLTVGATANTTWGMSLTPSVGFERMHSRVDIPGLPTEPFQQAHGGIDLVQHLLRGAGTVGAASALDAARGNRKAAEYTVAFTAQEQALTTATAYYQFVAAEDQLALLKRAMEGARHLAEESRILVASDQRPRTDLHQIDGNLATRTRGVVAARNAAVQALYSLRSAMGLSAEGAVAWRVTDALPAATAQNPERNELLRVARQRRADLAAAREVVGATGADLRGADWNTNPLLDVSASAGFAGYKDKDGFAPFFAAVGANVPGLNAGVGLSGELPLNNTAQLGLRDQKRALHEQARIAQADIERRVPIDTLSALENLQLSAAALEASNAAVEGLAAAVEDEHDRMRSGVGTVIDLLLTEDRMVTAELAQSNDHLSYAIAKSRLLFETGGMPSVPGTTSFALRDFSMPRAPDGGK
jgi:outer membrane protein TolC